MRFVAILLALVTVSSLYAAEPALVERSVLDGRVSLLMPAAFTPMDQEMLRAKYAGRSRPTLVYTNEEGSVNIAVNHTDSRMPPNQLVVQHKSMEADFKGAFPTGRWFRSEIRNIHGRECFIMDFRTPAIDTEIRNVILGTSLDDRLLLILFNVPSELEKEWLPTAYRIIESVKVK